MPAYAAVGALARQNELFRNFSSHAACPGQSHDSAHPATSTTSSAPPQSPSSWPRRLSDSKVQALPEPPQSLPRPPDAYTIYCPPEPRTTEHVGSPSAGSYLRRLPDTDPSTPAREYPPRKTSSAFQVHPNAPEIFSSAPSLKDAERTCGSQSRSAPYAVRTREYPRSVLSIYFSSPPPGAREPPAPLHNRTG